MKILHVNKFFDDRDGVDIYLRRLMREQEQQGHEVHVFSTQSPLNGPSPDAHFFIERFRFDRSEGLAQDARKARAFLWNREAKQGMERLLDHLRPDVVHLHNIYHHLSSSILAPIRKRGIRCVQTLHDYKLACPNYRMYTQGAVCERCKGGKYWNAVTHRCLWPSWAPNVLAAFEMGMTKAVQSYERTVHTFFCPSRFLKEKMEDWGEPAAKLQYLPNPVALPERAVVRGGGYILYAGRLSVEKGLRRFLEAAVKIPELPIKIAGIGPEEERLRSLVRASSASHIEFLGFQEPDRLALIRERAEAFVLPSVWYENASIALLEAMADGLPCLTTRIGGNPELVEDGANGFLARPDDVEDWTHVLRRFLATTREARDMMAERGREKIRANHLWKTHLSKLDAWYKTGV